MFKCSSALQIRRQIKSKTNSESQQYKLSSPLTNWTAFGKLILTLLLFLSSISDQGELGSWSKCISCGNVKRCCWEFMICRCQCWWGEVTLSLCVQLKFYDDALCEQHGLGHLTLATFFHFFDISQMTDVGKICKYLVNLLPQIDIW